MLEAIWEFRFLYRNLDDLVGAQPAPARALQPHRRSQSRPPWSRSARGLVRARAMRATPAEIRTLARNVLVVATYWLNFQSLRGRRRALADADLGQGAYQVMALVAPYLVQARPGAPRAPGPPLPRE